MRSIAKIIFLFTFIIASPKFSAAQKQGLAAIDSMKLLLKAHQKIDSNQIRIIYRISDVYLKIDSDSAMHYIQLGLDRAKKINWPKGIAAFYQNLGTINSDNSNFSKAIYYYNESLKISKSIGNRRGEASSIINIGVIYQQQGNGAKALEYAFNALKITQKIKEEDYTALLYNNIADVYIYNKDYEKAIYYGLKSYKQNEKIKNLSGLATSANQLGTTYNAVNDLKKARLYFDESLKICTELDNKTGQARALGNIALLHEDNKDKKLEFLFKARQIYDELNPLSTASITNMGNIGGTYAYIFIDKLKDSYPTRNFIPNDYPSISKKAELYLTKAINASKQVGDQDNLSYFSDNLSQLQEQNGEYKAALKNYKISRQIGDSLYSQESKNKIATLEAKFIFQKKEDQYKQQQELAKVKTQQIYLYAGLAIILISSVLLYLLNRANITQLRLKNELLRKEAEEKTKELLHQSKLFESELKAIRSQMNPHFIFNVLNSIESYIIDNDKKTASRLIQKFARLSRLILENSTKSLVTADKEWNALTLYTELEAMRYNNSFSYDFIVDKDLQLKSLLLPPMLIQPLIENAILHGLIVDNKSDAHLEVRLEKTESSLCVTVSDNGLGIENKAASPSKKLGGVKEKSMGIESIKERIEMINLQDNITTASFSIGAGKNNVGTVAIICLPLYYSSTMNDN